MMRWMSMDIEKLIAEMTLEEKCSLLSVGYSARHLIDKSSADIASHWASIQPAAEEALAKLYATYTTLK